MKDNKKVLYGLVALALVLSVVGISIGFAAMSTDLTINGSAEVVPASWDIKFKDLSSPTIAGDAEVTTAPTITSDTHIGNYAVKLTKPGDSVTYTFKVANDGTIDAKLTDFIKATPTFTGTGATASADATIVQNNFEYTVTYSDDTAITKNTDELDAESYKTVKLVVGYKADATELPTNTVTISGLDVTFTYGQK